MARLRAPQGCPWDRQQTLQSLRAYLLEETYEVLQAMSAGRPDEHCEELGDLLFQIVFQSQIASEAGAFDFSDVVDRIATKIEHRHPHVFGQGTARTPAEVASAWESIKRQEKKRASALDGLPPALPALLFAQRLSERAARMGFDWRSAAEVLPKVQEELDELAQALADPDPNRRQSQVAWELGDALFALTNLSRHLGLVSEDLLRDACERFSKRFRQVERLAGERGIDMKTADLPALDRLWAEAKRIVDPT
jgi:MazG family protein